MSKFNYYLTQLKRLKPNKVYATNVKFTDSEGNATNNMSLNSESIPVFIEYLTSELARLNKLHSSEGTKKYE